jgi:LPXTG-motif cell wall-anchored protein
LPKTASQLPLVGLLGIGLLAIGASMTVARRRRAV